MQQTGQHSEEVKKIDTLQSIELSEGVEVQTRVAGVYARAIALLIDTAIMAAIYIAVMIILSILVVSLGFGTEFGLVKSFNIIVGVYFLILFCMLWFFHFFFERTLKAATPGKRALGLKVVSSDGTRASAKKIFIRNVLRAADMLPAVPFYLFFTNSDSASGLGTMLVGSYGFGLAACLFTPRFQRIGDLVAGTIVVHANTPIYASAPLPPAIQAKIPRLPIIREEQVAIRGFCERAGIWSGARRIEMAEKAEELTNKKGTEAVTELQAYAKWIVEKS